jgi:cell wall-associated NlpC family hydrolase
MSSQTIQTPVKRALIVETARKYLDVKWKHQGRNPEVGVDCAGLVVLVAKEIGLSSYDTVNYQRNAHNDAFVKHFANNMKKKRMLDRKVGDVLLFRDALFSCHSGFVSEKNGVQHIIHAYARYKKVVEEPLTDEWLSKISYCFEFEGVVD